MPLLRIFGSKKGIPNYTANRLQRWALTLLSYDFAIEYVPTDKFGNADILSRLISQHVKPDEDFVVACTNVEEDLRSVITSNINHLPLSFSMVQNATQTDSLLGKVARFTSAGWPRNRSDLKNWELQCFFDRRESLTVVQGCVVFGERLVVPQIYRKRCLAQLHKGHPGIQRMKSIARSFVYWPGIDQHIIDYIKACQPCASVVRTAEKAPPVPWPATPGPWYRVHIDYAGPLDGEYFLVVVDAHSKWPEIFPTKSITSGATINILRTLFANKGMPEVLVSDNGTQFTSADFGKFCSENGINHLTTPPFHPQSNGQAERFVDSFKRATKKIQQGEGSVKQALDTFLLTYRTTPNANVPEGKSPAEVMYGRPIRICLDLLRIPQPNPKVEIEESNKQPRSFERKQLVYAKVYANNKWTWEPGEVLEKVGHVIYNVWVNDRKLIRSHINQLRQRFPAQEKSGPSPTKDTHLPLSILLDEWDLPFQT
ncbi:uncharacterized protein K02A2.6-like [Uranotaenia lowii]|uniref:uncharacterized protein K02A2.6-like n=1 Tax=Uranotaenia lowii TaxID=190385 RepID=UPI00247AF2A8|nr:uncharacterized protein K02A2.6-like [Uranotaenia lowii]